MVTPLKDEPATESSFDGIWDGIAWDEQHASFFTLRETSAHRASRLLYADLVRRGHHLGFGGGVRSSKKYCIGVSDR